MKRTVAGAAVAAGLGAVAARRLLARASAAGRDDGRWLVVTVQCPPEALSEGDLPAPLARLGDKIEVRVAPAPGGRGTELAARPLEPGPSGPAARLAGDDPRQPVRQALREAKSLIETGEVMWADGPAAGRAAPGGKIIELATRRAGGEGRL
ncbi:hypothetical protein ACFVH6_29815 [Spirillospora sp. NPDC127200]